MNSNFNANPTAESTSGDSTIPGFRFEIIEREANAGNKPPVCDHTEVLDLLNDALDRLEEVESLLEIIARALFHGMGR